jgi:DNA polymerase-3 subunit gamma/tau
MLSTHSFNALLKTLEEPPPHVKFLLATTDPQKLPVTVLSRCLQFNLKRLPIAQITDRMREILEKEGIAFEPAGLRLVAQAADGSMRDGLSLLDQLIAFGGGTANEAEARAMLGTIARDHVVRLAELLGAMNVPELLSCARSLEEFAPDYAQVLDELASLFVRIAMKQAVNDFEGDELYAPEVLERLAKAIAPEDVQLFYQTTILGRRDLALAPDPRSGFEMTLLRMIAFRPLGEAEQPRSAPGPLGGSSGGGGPSVSGGGAAAARAAAAAGASGGRGGPSASGGAGTGVGSASPGSGVSTSAPASMLSGESSVSRASGTSGSSVPSTALGASGAPAASGAMTAEDVAALSGATPAAGAAAARAAVAGNSRSAASAATAQRGAALGALSGAPPGSGSGPAAPAGATSTMAAPSAHRDAPEPWTDIIARLDLGGAARQLASNCVLIGRQGAVVRLALDVRNKHMRTSAQEEKLAQALTRYYGQPTRLEFETAAMDVETPAQAEQRASIQDQEAARRAFDADPGVQALRERFGATVLPDTIRPVK